MYFRYFWQLFAALGYFWQLAASFGTFSLLLATFGYFWLPLATFGNYWQLLANVLGRYVAGQNVPGPTDISYSTLRHVTLETYNQSKHFILLENTVYRMWPQNLGAFVLSLPLLLLLYTFHILSNVFFWNWKISKKNSCVQKIVIFTQHKIIHW